MQWAQESKGKVKATDPSWAASVGAKAGRSIAKGLGVPEAVAEWGQRLGKSVSYGVQAAAWAMKQQQPKTTWETIKSKIDKVTNFLGKGKSKGKSDKWI